MINLLPLNRNPHKTFSEGDIFEEVGLGGNTDGKICQLGGGCGGNIWHNYCRQILLLNSGISTDCWDTAHHLQVLGCCSQFPGDFRNFRRVGMSDFI